MTKVQEMAQWALGRDAEAPLIEFAGHWHTIGEIRRLGEAVNALIDAGGAEERAPIAFVPRNRPAMLAAMLGLAARGRYVRMIHPYQSPAGIARDLERLRPAMLVALAEDFVDEVPELLAARDIGGIALDGMDARAFAGAERATSDHAPVPSEPQFDVLTSGTTGPPKQFPITYEFIAREMVAGSTMAADAEAPDPLTLAPAHLYWPFGNFSGLYSTLTPMLLGMRGVLSDRFRVADFHDYLRTYKPEMIGLPPSGVQMVLDADLPVEDFASVKFVRVGSAPLPLASQAAFEDRYGIPILQAYGATEFGGPVTNMPLEAYLEFGRKKMGSVGLPFRGAQLRAVDPATGEMLPPGSEGLLEVIAPRMGDDWIRTSDIGVVDEDGFVWHRGRADGAIMRGGFKLLPETIEQALVRHPAVAAAMATGIPDHRLGQVPAVGIRLKPDAAEPSLKELETHLRAEIEATHIPVSWRFLETLPYNAMMKPDRIALSRLFAETA